MARITVFTTAWCGYCVRAKELLRQRGLEFEEVPLDGRASFREELRARTGGWMVPQILIDDRPIGGFTELWQLDKAGALSELVG